MLIDRQDGGANWLPSRIAVLGVCIYMLVSTECVYVHSPLCIDSMVSFVSDLHSEWLSYSSGAHYNVIATAYRKGKVHGWGAQGTGVCNCLSDPYGRFIIDGTKGTNRDVTYL